MKFSKELNKGILIGGVAVGAIAIPICLCYGHKLGYNKCESQYHDLVHDILRRVKYLETDSSINNASLVENQGCKNMSSDE